MNPTAECKERASWGWGADHESQPKTGLCLLQRLYPMALSAQPGGDVLPGAWVGQQHQQGLAALSLTQPELEPDEGFRATPGGQVELFPMLFHLGEGSITHDGRHYGRDGGMKQRLWALMGKGILPEHFLMEIEIKWPAFPP